MSKNILDGSVVVAPGDHPALLSRSAAVKQEDFRWIAGAPPEVLTGMSESSSHSVHADEAVLRCQFRVRYREDLAWCRVHLQDNTLIVRFDEPKLAVAPGQVLALYQGDECLGGGEILKQDANSCNDDYR